jgi:FRG domain
MVSYENIGEKYLGTHPTAGELLLFVTKVMRAFESAKRRKDVYEFIAENLYWFASQGFSLEHPKYHVLPPTPLHPAVWIERVKGLNIDRKVLERLFASGFMPISFAHKLEINRRASSIVDTFNGVALASANGKPTNVTMEDRFVERYSDLRGSFGKEYILGVGAIRGQKLLNGHVEDSCTIPAFRVSSREQLNATFDKLKEAAGKAGLELWFRGQTGHYLLPELPPEIVYSVCPWRDEPAPSLVPSLYRNVAAELLDLRTYTLQRLSARMLAIRVKMAGFETFYSEDEHELMGGFPKIAAGQGFEGLEIEITREIVGKGLDLPPEERAVFTKSLVSPAHVERKVALILQHYGTPTGLLDITRDIDIALHFAQFDMSGRRPTKGAPVIYAFLLDPHRDPYLDGQKLYDRIGALRPQRQQCGAMLGATLINTNLYARFIAAEIFLDDFISPQNVSHVHLLPDVDEDEVLRMLQEVKSQSVA